MFSSATDSKIVTTETTNSYFAYIEEKLNREAANREWIELEFADEFILVDELETQSWSSAKS